MDAAEAERLPFLDCKGFAALAAEYARKLGLDAKILVGFSGAGKTAHAYVAVDNGHRRVYFSSGMPNPTDESTIKRMHRINHVFPLR